MSNEPVFGTEMTAIMLAVGLAYFFVSWSPLLWPAFQAFRHRPQHPRPLLFTLVVGCLVYGVFFFLGTALLLSAQAYSVFVAPSLAAADRPYGHWLVSATRFITNYWWIGLPPLLLFVTVLCTRRVSRVWPVVCQALAPNNSFKPNPLRGSA
jgi:hypothetical protein